MPGTGRWAACGLILSAATLAGCAGSSPRFYSRPSQPPPPPAETETYQLQGVASYYADEFNGRKTADGETYDMNSLTAAHRTLPFNTLVKVLNLATRLSVVVRINDRGPFKDNRVIDLSLEAARKIGLIGSGTAPVALEIVQLGSPAN